MKRAARAARDDEPGVGPEEAVGPDGDGGDDGGPAELEEGERRFSLRAVLDFVKSVPSFVKLLYRLMRDRRVSLFDRVLFGLTLGYLVTPLDLVPDWLPVVGELDDLLVVVVALDRLLYRTPEEVLVEHWDGDARPLLVLRDLLDRGARALPGWARGLLRSG